MRRSRLGSAKGEGRRERERERERQPASVCVFVCARVCVCMFVSVCVRACVYVCQGDSTQGEPGASTHTPHTAPVCVCGVCSRLTAESFSRRKWRRRWRRVAWSEIRPSQIRARAHTHGSRGERGRRKEGHERQEGGRQRGCSTGLVRVVSNVFGVTIACCKPFIFTICILFTEREQA